MRFSTLTRVVAVACALPVAATAADWDLTRVRNTYEDATVFIEIEAKGKVRETGSGVVLTETGFVLSARHLLDCLECRTAGTYWAKSSALPGRVRLNLIDEESKHDLVLFQLALPDPSWRGGKLPVIGAPIEAGRPLFALGYPLSRDEFPYIGLLGALLGDRLADGRWQTDLPLTHGNSGGPVFDVNGSLVAIALSGVKGEPGQNFVAPIKLAERLLRTANVRLPGSHGMPAAEGIVLYIDTSTIKGRQTAIDVVLKTIGMLSDELVSIRLTKLRGEATHILTLDRLQEISGFPTLSALYGQVGDQPRPVDGDCSEEGCNGSDAPGRALKSLIENTLLNRQLDIESCKPEEDRRYMKLKVKWQGRFGFPYGDPVFYEIGVTRSDSTEPSRTGYFVKAGKVAPAGSSAAEGQFSRLPISSRYRPAACEFAGKTTNEVLMVRFRPRLPPDSPADTSPWSLVSSPQQ